MGEGRQTLGRAIAVEGIGLHTGAPASATLRPAPPGAGLAFRRSDLPRTPVIPATVDRVVACDRGTTLGVADAAVHTVEHALAALAACEIDDATIDLDGPELPAGDGSAAPYAAAIAAAGVVPSAGEPARLAATEPFVVEAGGARYTVAPSAGLTLDVTIAWDHPLIGRQSGRYDLTPETFQRELAAARTFGFAAEHRALAARGLARGASPANAIVLTATGIVGSTLRWPDEFVRHKATDLIGDLALLGARLAAEITAFRPSHRGNVALARALAHAATEVLTP